MGGGGAVKAHSYKNYGGGVQAWKFNYRMGVMHNLIMGGNEIELQVGGSSPFPFIICNAIALSNIYGTHIQTIKKFSLQWLFILKDP